MADSQPAVLVMCLAVHAQADGGTVHSLRNPIQFDEARHGE